MAIFELSENLKQINKSNPLKEESEAEQAENDLMRLFPAMSCGDIQDLKVLINEVRDLYASRRVQYIRTRILPIVNRLKKQGILFGYPLVSDVSGHLEQFIQKKDSFSNVDLTILQKDALLLQEIIWKKIHGDGGEKGRKILNQLVKVSK